MNGAAYLADAIRRFREAQAQAEGALAQVPFERWHQRLDPESNSLATLVLHLSGNLRSRWSDFLQSDGEKPDRDRDAEFEDPATLTQQLLLEGWSQGWTCLFAALTGLAESDLERTITIRAQPHSVVEAINRQLAHYPYHVGQLVFLAKHLAGRDWQTLSVPRRGSVAFNEAMRRKPAGS